LVRVEAGKRYDLGPEVPMNPISAVCALLSLAAMSFLAAPAAAAAEPGAELIAAAQRGDVERVVALLAAGAPVDSRSPYGATPLFFAVDKGNVRLATLLLEAGASVEVVDSFYQATPLQWAIFKAADSEAHRGLVRQMVPHATKGSAVTGAALLLGAQTGDVELVHLALAAQAPMTERRAALDLARRAGAGAVVEVLEPVTTAAEVFQLAAAELGRYVGDYRGADLTAKVEAVDGALRMIVPGQEPLALAPASASEFSIAAAPGVAIRFALGEGPATAVTIVQGERETVLARTAEVSPAPVKAGSVEWPAQPSAGPAQPWPAFRGANRAGIADGQGAPRVWNAETGHNLAWKTAIPGLGLSSPVIWGNRIFVTTAVSANADTSLRTGLYGDVDSVEDQSVHTWKLLAVALDNGAVLWQQEVATGAPKVKRHLKSSHANSTAATDGRTVVASFGSEGLAAFTVEGELRWKVDLGVLSAGWFFDPTYEWEFASSPIIHDGKVILQADVHGGAFVVAFDLETGRQLWRTPREEIPTWSTPAVLPGDGGPDELITNGSRAVRGYDLASGAELWRLSPNSEIVVASPIVAAGRAYVVGGYPPVQPIYAVRPGGRGDLSLATGATTNAHVVWSRPRGGSYIPTPIAYQGMIYVLHNNGRLAAYDANTGEEIYRERVGRGEGFSGSAVAADGVLSLAAEGGTVYQVRAGRAFEILGTNEVGEAILTTPAVSAGTVVVRGERHLFAFREPKAETVSSAGP
jgi:outer membrane protein assembly factor BamB